MIAPQALLGARWTATRRTREDWGPGSIGVTAEYGVFVPEVVRAAVRAI
jgi:hypothetical protein